MRFFNGSPYAVKLVCPSFIRSEFSKKMSAMYRSEVPQYGRLLDKVKDVNATKLQSGKNHSDNLQTFGSLDRITEERHGAIRLGKSEELSGMRDLFKVMGMHPVGYYDLSVAGMPVHSTAFRPVTDDELKANPFRIFTSLLRPELIKDKASAALIKEILDKREIFSPELKALIAINKRQNGLTESQALKFIDHALDVFRWHDIANVSFEDYQKLKKIHPLAADIVSFKGPHINHLTPRTLDIDAIQHVMTNEKMNPKAVIEGPPARKVPILLRQTSFKALNEAVNFINKNGQIIRADHSARFGEIEERGVALKPKGLALYNQLSSNVREKIIPLQDGSNSNVYYQILENVFLEFPDDLDLLRQQDMVYLCYQPTKKGREMSGCIEELSLDDLIKHGYVAYSPIIYEDFLPVSAAGIFSSNLGDDQSQVLCVGPNQDLFEESLGQKVEDPIRWYEKQEADSIQRTLSALYPQELTNNKLTSLSH